MILDFENKEERKNIIGTANLLIERLIVEDFKNKGYRIVGKNTEEIDIKENDIQYVFNKEGLDFLKKEIVSLQFKYFYTIPKIISINPDVNDEILPIIKEEFKGFIDNESSCVKENIVLIVGKQQKYISSSALPFNVKVLVQDSHKSDSYINIDIKNVNEYVDLICKTKVLITSNKSFEEKIIISDVINTKGKIIITEEEDNLTEAVLRLIKE